MAGARLDIKAALNQFSFDHRDDTTLLVRFPGRGAYEANSLPHFWLTANFNRPHRYALSPSTRRNSYRGIAVL